MMNCFAWKQANKRKTLLARRKLVLTSVSPSLDFIKFSLTLRLSMQQTFFFCKQNSFKFFTINSCLFSNTLEALQLLIDLHTQNDKLFSPKLIFSSSFIFSLAFFTVKLITFYRKTPNHLFTFFSFTQKRKQIFRLLSTFFSA